MGRWKGKGRRMGKGKRLGERGRQKGFILAGGGRAGGMNREIEFSWPTGRLQPGRGHPPGRPRRPMCRAQTYADRSTQYSQLRLGQS